MDLRTGRPVWLAHGSPGGHEPALRSDASADVAIIGAGITGALVAHQLVKAGLSVVLVDGRKPAHASTAASTGLLMYQTDASLAELTQRHGPRTSRRVYQLGRRAIQEICSVIKELDIECGWRAKRTLYVASVPQHRARLKREAKESRRIGFSVTYLDAAALRRRYGLKKPGAILSTGAGEVDAFRLTRGILDHHRRNRAIRIFADTTVTRIHETPEGAELQLGDGHRVRARHVVIAAGYEAGRFVKTELARLHSTYAIASKPMPSRPLWPTECLMWETARPYFYLRTTPDHRILFGGADEPFANPSRRDRKLRSKTRELERRFAGLFPHLAFDAEYAWTGTFAETLDGLPCIGAVRPGSRVLCALGYGGNGITFSQIAARILRDLCLGKRNRDSDLFRLDRSAGRA